MRRRGEALLGVVVFLLALALASVLGYDIGFRHGALAVHDGRYVVDRHTLPDGKVVTTVVKVKEVQRGE